MSLLERSQKTVNPNLTKQQINANALQNASHATNKVLLLHKQIQEIMSSDKLAELIVKNPRMARIEIRNAAFRILSNPQ